MNDELHFIKDTEEIGSLIKETRKEQGLTQEDLAGVSGTGRRFISDIENGKETVQVGKLFSVLKALGIGFGIGLGLGLYLSSKNKER